MKYLRLFETDADYQSYVGGGGDDYVTPHVALVRSSNAVKYKKYDKTNDYCTIEALEDDFQIEFYNECNAQYSLNGEPWTPFGEDYMSPIMNVGDKLCIKGELEPGNMTGQFYTEQSFNLSGNCNSLIFGDDARLHDDLTEYNDCYNSLFSSCTGLRNVSKDFLPITTLADNCYDNMFSDCTSLVNAPELPATTLAEGCYSYMFTGCKSLINAPELPATTLAEGCYSYMFYDCTSLVNAPELPATTLAEGCYDGMLYGTNLLPDLTNIDFASESVVASGGLEGLFAGTKVTDEDLYNILPINPSTGKYWLPVTALTESCYYNMFEGCTSLVTAPELPATELPKNCYLYMFDVCTSLVNAPELPATTLAEGCYSYMFSDCTSLVNAPALPATNLTIWCYLGMFKGCTSLNYIKMLATDISASNCLNNWVKGVSSTGTFVKNAAATWDVTGVNGIPEGWTVETATV